jgi:HEAT repeats
MRTSKAMLFLFLLVFVVVPLSALPNRSLADSLAMLHSYDSNIRINAFYGLFKPPLGESVKADAATLKLLRDNPDRRTAISQAFIDLLAWENSLINEAPSGSLPESYGEYHASLIWSVGALRDGSAVNALLGAIKTGGLATDGLAKLGIHALPAVLTAADSSDPDIRLGATIVFGKMAAQVRELALDSAAVESIKSGLLRALSDPNTFVRVAAVGSLEPFADADVAAAMRRASTVDDSEQVRGAASDWLGKHPQP